MSEYHAPVKEMLFVLRHVAGLDAVSRLPGYEDVTPDLVESVLTEAALLATNVIAPTNRIGDAVGTRVEDGQVIVPPEFTSAYREFTGGGWAGLSQNPDFGGQGLPYLVGVAVEEMWQAANLAWSLGPLLTQGAARAIEAHGSEAQRALYLPRMVAGEWSGTMNLTEPQAGSDLAAVRSQAVPDGDRYRITGQKIFITWGDHDMTANVVHLVLARLPDAPPGTRGLSLFLVPKFIPQADGKPGARNSVHVVSVEHKLGIHGSPTCVMAFEGAVGELMGGKNQGLACMFTMMNHARLGVGMEGIAIAERAYQQARAYARERVQGRVPGIEGRAAIIHHGDVRRMLLTMKAQIEAMRGVACIAAASLDHAHRATDPAERARHQARVDLLTPVVKGWCTETGQQLTSVGLQVHGGMGYVEETGAAQHFRDGRITTIYEGTTGIQAADLVGRKILGDGGAALQALIADMTATLPELERAGEPLAVLHSALQEGIESVVAAGRWLAANHARHPGVAGGISWNLLMLLGTVAGGWVMARAALAAQAQLAAGTSDVAFCEAKLLTARFHATQVMPVATAWRRGIEAGCEALLALPEEQF
ncbi:MAG: acyl-CoA dehydrogenase C-terminal domain-containing protein [Gammaproteobacteria bacterium]|nr:acyl-CoA dehydrogenase C-terminal domain-containing protein [Gammaproteobacteria bacterium]